MNILTKHINYSYLQQKDLSAGQTDYSRLKLQKLWKKAILEL